MGYIELLDAYNIVINEWKERTENKNGDVLDLIDRGVVICENTHRRGLLLTGINPSFDEKKMIRVISISSFLMQKTKAGADIGRKSTSSSVVVILIWFKIIWDIWICFLLKKAVNLDSRRFFVHTMT